MPPKSDKAAKVTILKFKNGKLTYILPIDFNLKNSQTLNNFKKLLSNIINQSGGLPVGEDGPAPMDEDDIEIPKSEFLDEDDIEVPKSEFIDENDRDLVKPDVKLELPNSGKLVDENDLKFGIPKDKTNPYGNEWIEVNDDILSELTFNDYDILSFAVGDDEFQIVEAAYEE